MQNLAITQEGDIATIVPAGDIVAATTPPLRAAMRDLVRQGIREMVIDLTNTTMIDSAGLGLIMAAHNSLKGKGEIKVVQASADLLNLFHAMRIHQHLTVSGAR
jgi:anti-anti-sigma factor